MPRQGRSSSKTSRQRRAPRAKAPRAAKAVEGRKKSGPNRNDDAALKRAKVSTPTKKISTRVAPLDPELRAPTLPFPVVGIGASAGGLEAFRQLLEQLSPDSGMSYVLVQHLDPTHASSLAGILAQKSPIPVQEVHNGIRLELDCAYVIPPNASMTLMDGHLRLTPRQIGRGIPMPVNDFFRSLAESQGRRAIGVVLSGTATDGAMGLEAIKGAGGITFAQTEESAKFDGMPRSAIATGCVDFVLSPGDIAKELARIARHHYMAPADPEVDAELVGNDGDLERILAVLRKSCGVDFGQYKVGTLRRRIRRRMLLQRLDSLDDYARAIQRDAAEAEALCQDLLIRVTHFFRDPGVFEVLKQTVFPELVGGRPADVPIRVWVPGCSTGEEAYSLAMCLMEFLDDLPDAPSVQLYATDVNETAILRARAGVYLDSIAADVSPERLRRFFAREERGYRVNSNIRDLCVFAKQDLTRDPPFSQIDLISCRNVLIYLGHELQKRVFAMFHYALRPTGVLVLGGAESVGAFPELFASTSKKHRIYRKNPAPPGLLQFDMLPAIRAVPAGAGGRPKAVRSRDVSTLRDLQRAADRIVLTAMAPVGVVVNEYLEVVQFRGRTGPFLEPPAGAASFHLLKMARPEFLGPLRAGLEEAGKVSQTVCKAGIKTIIAGRPAYFTLEIIPFKAVPTGQRFFVVLFSPEITAGARRSDGASKRAPAGRAATRRAHELEQELAATKEYMQAIVEEQEATNEELRSSTEEIQSSYEELQSGNEELETAKEELQSANEELTTVNEELHRRTLDLSDVNNDLSNFLASANLPLIRVGNDLRIRRFTPNAERVLNIIAADIGRPISDITLKVGIPDFEGMVLRVMDTLVVAERQVQDQDGHWWSVRVRPYRTSEHKIDGVVVAFVDVDSLNENSRAAQSARLHVDRIQNVAAALSETLEPVQAAAVMVREAAEALGAMAAIVALKREDAGWEPLYTTGVRADVVEQLRGLGAKGAAPIGWVLMTHERLVLGSPAEIKKRFPEAAGAHADAGARAVVALPLEAEGQVMGAVSLYFSDARAPSESDLALMRMIALMGAQALRRTQQNAIERSLRDELDRARKGTPLGRAGDAKGRPVKGSELIGGQAVETDGRSDGAVEDELAPLGRQEKRSGVT
jgi:two-component system, chemotaxis family, CheB/CheR fusion protein